MRQTKAVQVKHLQIGGGAPVVIQSMTKTDTADVGATVAQIEEMVRAGCEIVRLAVPDNDAAIALKEIRKRVPDVPLVADIHFHYKLALMALEAGIDKLRLNPGNIGAHDEWRIFHFILKYFNPVLIAFLLKLASHDLLVARDFSRVYQFTL